MYKNNPDAQHFAFARMCADLAADQHAARVRTQEPKYMFQRDRLPHPAAPHDDARLSMVDEEADVVENEVIVKGFADVAEFDEVAPGSRLCILEESRTHVRPLLLTTPRAEANQIFSSTGFSLSVLAHALHKTHRLKPAPLSPPVEN